MTSSIKARNKKHCMQEVLCCRIVNKAVVVEADFASRPRSFFGRDPTI
jgi:hypothetical protein